MLTVSSLSTLSCAFADGGGGLIFWRRGKEEKGVSYRGVLIYKLVVFSLYQLCLLRQLDLKIISYQYFTVDCSGEKNKNSSATTAFTETVPAVPDFKAK